EWYVDPDSIYDVISARDEHIAEAQCIPDAINIAATHNGLRSMLEMALGLVNNMPRLPFGHTQQCSCAELEAHARLQVQHNTTQRIILAMLAPFCKYFNVPMEVE
ncbi:hypothetical protein LCGC14_2944800, partial [marine sediment metagenome]